MWRCVAIWYRLGVPDHAAVVHAPVPVPVDIDTVVAHCNEHLAERYADVPATHARVR
jgi:hypothetical protein